MSGARPCHDHAAVSDRREPHKDLHQGRTPLPPVTTTTVSPSTTRRPRGNRPKVSLYAGECKPCRQPESRAVLLRVAVLADIHGNLPALDAVLDDIDAAGVDASCSTAT
jgi:hypothetical protein